MRHNVIHESKSTACEKNHHTFCHEVCDTLNEKVLQY